MTKILRCYAVGRDGEWEAYCLDLDIAVQGASFTEVRDALATSVRLYVESLEDVSEADRVRLMNRSAPFSEWLKYKYIMLRAKIEEELSTLRLVQK